MDHDDVTPDNLPGTGKPWEPDYSHTDPDIDMKGPHFHGWILQHDPETLAPYYTPMLRAYLSRNNANYHAKKRAEPKHGSVGLMVIKCEGDNAACPAWQYHRRIEMEDADNG